MKIIKLIIQDILFILGLAILTGICSYGGIKMITPKVCSSGNATILPTMPIYLLIFLIDIIFLVLFFIINHKKPLLKRYWLYLLAILLTYSIGLYQLSLYCF